ncbi:hypothetical protein H0E87_027395 [Populus deltoides]|uniref:Carnosine N-methyltransferase n=1 Tax=Populus deltoides TaxID=3696 RepID=A0A8T2WYW8_POPDE|nr:hypothetical protein H0E87_027395 [Populus deltoides]
MQGNGLYILGSIAIAIHFQTVTNSVLFHSQIFIQQVQGLLKDSPCVVVTLLKSIVIQVQVGVWDAVVTCFFIDTAHNIVEYIEIISRILKDGGVWINLGPLLYHFAGMYGQEDEMSIELSLEDVKCVAFNYGFEVEKEKTIETTYTTNPRSMMQNRYFAAFWTMRKKSAAVEKHST